MSDKGNLFAIGDGRGDYHFRLYNSESDGLFYIELGAHLAGKCDYESMTTIRVVLQEFYKWMVFWGIEQIHRLTQEIIRKEIYGRDEVLNL